MKMGSHVIEEDFTYTQARDVVNRLRFLILEDGHFNYEDVETYLYDSIAAVHKIMPRDHMFRIILCDLEELKKELEA